MTILLCPTDERVVLMSIFEATNGRQWEHNHGWGTTEPLPEWHGVIVEGGRVVVLELSGTGLRGSIPRELGHLSGLNWLRLERNQLSGE
ncbi:unnamed protein product, partial [Chrysoparadoxa australica]